MRVVMIGKGAYCGGAGEARQIALPANSMRTDVVRIALFGSSGVGKSALAVRLLTRRFIGDYTSDHDLYYKHQFPLNESTLVKVEILDASARKVDGGCGVQQQQLRHHVHHHHVHHHHAQQQQQQQQACSELEERVAWCGAAVIVYSLDDRKSFERAREALRFARRARPRLPCLLLGNKRDLDHSRAVSRADGCELALAHLPCQFAEVSAADDYDVIVGLFTGLAREAVAQQSRKSPPKRRKSIVHVAKALGTVFSAKGLHRARPPSPPL